MMITIKRAAALTLAAITAVSLTACGSKQEAETVLATEPDTSITETIPSTERTSEPTEPEGNSTYRAAFAKQLSALRTKFGAPEGEFAMEKSGVLFADLLDWDGDGTPELFTLTHEGIVNERDTFRLCVWKEQNGTAVSLLDTVVGSSYGYLSSDLDFYLMMDSDGALSLCVDDSHEFKDIKETYYVLSAGTLRSTVLTAQSSVGGWTEDAEPVDPDAYQIDGKACDKAAFDARRSALGRDNMLTVYCQRNYELDALDAFLTEQSDVYTSGAWLEAASFLDDPSPAWLEDALFTKQ